MQLTSAASSHAVDDAAYNDELLAEVTWLKDMLFPRLVSLVERGEYVSPLVHWRAPYGEELVSMHDFAARYQTLKDKYAAMLFEVSLVIPMPSVLPVLLWPAYNQASCCCLQIWPDNTDPQKFVYEEMSIAAFLLELWARLDRDAADVASTPAADKPQFRYKFADLGCGNGLWTFLLTAEGYPGYGVDLRRRRLWDMFDPKPELREEAVLPNERLTLPEYVRIV